MTPYQGIGHRFEPLLTSRAGRSNFLSSIKYLSELSPAKVLVIDSNHFLLVKQVALIFLFSIKTFYKSVGSMVLVSGLNHLFTNKTGRLNFLVALKDNSLLVNLAGLI